MMSGLAGGVGKNAKATKLAPQRAGAKERKEGNLCASPPMASVAGYSAMAEFKCSGTSKSNYDAGAQINGLKS